MVGRGGGGGIKGTVLGVTAPMLYWKRLDIDLFLGKIPR